MWIRFLLASWIGLSGVALAAEDTLDLSGTWRFRMDPGNVGVAEGWAGVAFEDEARLPGSMDENGLGNPVEEASLAYLSRLHAYTGAAWYHKDVTVPKEWRHKHIVLFLERCHWETRLWVDGKEIGLRDSLATAHEYDLTDSLTPGTHRLALRVDNTMKYTIGEWSHSITEHTQTNWNGVIGQMELRASDPVYIESVRVNPDIAKKSARVRVTIVNATGSPRRASLALAVVGEGQKALPAPAPVKMRLDAGSTDVEVAVPLGDRLALWDEFDPNLYTLSVSLSGRGFGPGRFRDDEQVIFGLRDLSTRDGQFLVNGRPTLLRGNLECCIFPMTAYPPMEVEPWLRICRIAKEHGLNHFRFHSWCPPEAAFEAADRTGIMLQVEVDVWTRLGEDEKLGQFIHDESDRILKAYGNHPSFCMLVVGNEPAGPRQKESLAQIVTDWKSKDPRRLYCGTSGWPVLEENDYHVLHENNKTPIRIHGAPMRAGTDFDYRAAISGVRAPVVAHELGQWCVYPSYAEIPKYTGVLRARNLETFRDSLAAHGMADQAQAFARASGALQLLMYKADVEAILRTPNIGGYQLLQLQDFPGQGTALVGFLDAFWDPKEGVTTDSLRRFCGETVPLLWTKKFTWTVSENLEGQVQMSHFGPAPLEKAVVAWTLAYADGTVLAAGELPARTISQGSGFSFGDLSIDLAQAKAPARLDLTLALKGTSIANQWPVWVYPDSVDTAVPPGVLVTEHLDERAMTHLRRGGRVVCVPREGLSKTVKTSFEPTFWNISWFAGQPRHLGLLCDPNHPAFAAFPTESHTNWQWFDLLQNARGLVLDDLPLAFRPTVQIIDNWTANRRLGCLLEARVGKGRLLVSTLALGPREANPSPAQRQMWHSLLAYAGSEAFAPKDSLEPEAVAGLLAPSTHYEGVEVVSVDSQTRGFAGPNAVDGDPDTIWHTKYDGTVPAHPHEIRLRLPEAKPIHGIRYLPRQDMSNGWITDYEIYVSADGEAWGEPVAKGTFAKSSDLQEVRLREPVTARFVRLVALGEANGQPFTSIAELEVF